MNILVFTTYLIFPAPAEQEMVSENIFIIVKRFKLIFYCVLLIFFKSPYTRTKFITLNEELILIWGKALAQHFQDDIANKAKH